MHPKTTDPELCQDKGFKHLTRRQYYTKAHTLRIKDELKYLYMKKQQLNHQIYHLHVSQANSWGNTWPYIQQTIEVKLKNEAQQKYKNIDKKLDTLTRKQTKTLKQTHTFYPRVVNRQTLHLRVMKQIF
jgi:hypothetical protein